MTGSLSRLWIALFVFIVGFTFADDASAQKKVRFAYPSSADMGALT